VSWVTPKKVTVATAAVPALALLPLFVDKPYGPVLHLGDSASYLDLWGVISIVAAGILAIPGAVMAYKWRGAWLAACLLAWLAAVAGFAYFGARWIS